MQEATNNDGWTTDNNIHQYSLTREIWVQICDKLDGEGHWAIAVNGKNWWYPQQDPPQTLQAAKAKALRTLGNYLRSWADYAHEAGKQIEAGMVADHQEQQTNS